MNITIIIIGDDRPKLMSPIMEEVERPVMLTDLFPDGMFLSREKAVAEEMPMTIQRSKQLLEAIFGEQEEEVQTMAEMIEEFQPAPNPNVLGLFDFLNRKMQEDMTLEKALGIHDQVEAEFEAHNPHPSEPEFFKEFMDKRTA